MSESATVLPKLRILAVMPILIGLLAMLAGCASGPPDAAADAAAPVIAVPEAADTAALDEPIPIDPALVTGELENGLRYYIRENEEPINRAELRLVVDVGSVVEDDDQLGLAHVLEHMAFNGTENFEKQELVDFMESIGMRLGSDLNAGTGFDETIYQLRVPMDSPEPIRTALQIMDDWVDGITLEPAEAEQERLVVIEEWRGRQNANTRVQEAQMPVVLQDSRYADRLPIGTLESLQTFELESLRRFYEDWYRPDLMAVIVVGDFDAAEIEALVREQFSDLPAADDPRERIRYEVPPYEGTRISVVTDPELPQTTIGVAYRLEREDDWTIGGARRRIVEGLYSNMFTQRLAELTRQTDPPFIVGIGSKTETFMNTGPAFVLTALVQGDGVERALETLITESERAMRFGFTEAELERTKTMLRRQLERQYENRDSQTSASFAGQYISMFLRGNPAAGIEYTTRLSNRFIDEITLDDVNEIGRQWVGDTNRVVLLTAPERDDLTIPSPDELVAVIDSGADTDVEAYADADEELVLLSDLPEGSPIVSESERPIGLTEWQLENGVRVILKPTDFDDDVILMRSYSPGGMSLASDEDLVAARTALRIVGNGGLGDLDANQLRRVLSETIASANPSIGEFTEGINGSASPRDLETLMQLVYLRFTQPRVDDAAVDVFMAQAEAMLGNRDLNPAVAFSDRFAEIMTQDHPRRQPETLDMLEEVDREKSLAFYRERFADASDFTFVFVGAIDVDTMRPLVERYLGALPSIGRDETWRDVGVREPEGIIEDTIYRGLEPVARTRIAMTGPIDLVDPYERTWHVATSRVLQARLTDVLREGLGATYSVGVGGGSSWWPEQRFAVTIEFSSDPDRVDELVDRIFEEIETLKSEGPTESEVADVREALLRQFELNLESNAYWASTIAASDQYGFDTGETWRQEYPGSIESLTVERVQQGMHRFVDLENYVRLTLLPESMAPTSSD